MVILSAFVYRIGGMSKEQAKQYFPWFPQWMVKSWFRDLNCSLIWVAWMLFFLPKVAWFWYLIPIPLSYLALNSYFQRFPPDKGEDKFYYHGLAIGLSGLFIAIPAGLWLGCLIRAVVMAVFMWGWCKVFSNDFVEEFGRGAIIAASLPLLLI